MNLPELDKQLHLLNGINALLHWDRSVLMPAKAIEQRADQMALISLRMHELLTSNEMERALREFKPKSALDNARVERYTFKLNRIRKVPKEHVEEFAKLTGLAEHQWERAKQQNNFSLFQPYLEKIIAMKRKEAAYIDAKRDPYDVLLEPYERGMTSAKIDRIFDQLKRGLQDIIAKQKNKKVPSLKGTFAEEQQKLITRDIAFRILGDNGRFLLGRSAHPFSTTISADDLRITTDFRKDPFFSFSSTVHECGHSLYESQFAPELRNTILFDAPSYGLHESQSRLWENHICKGRPFWTFYFSRYKKMLGVRMTFEEFYTAMNAIKLCFIRIESDEVTYCLHIIIRYELEKDLLRGKLDVKDLPRAWNRKYAEYLGVTPPTDAQGVLQDVHWSMGELGYFPTYALGTVYSAMLYAAMLRQHPLLEKELAQGKLQFVKDWLRENVHKHGASKLTPDIIRAACGKDLDAADFLQYLHKKYERM